MQREEKIRKQREWDEKPFLDKAFTIAQDTGQGIINTVGGAIAEAPNIVGNTLNFAGTTASYLNPASYLNAAIQGKPVDELYTDTIGKHITNVSTGASDFVKKYGSYEKDSLGATIG